MKTLTATLLLLPACLTALAQVSQADLEGLERHRKPQRTVSVLQSIDDAQDTSRWDSSLIGTWDFLDEEERAADGGIEEIEEEEGLQADRTTMQGRVAMLPAELLIPYNDALERQIANYVVRHAGALRGILGKYAHYERAFRSAFASQGIPEELTALAIVESAMNPLARSNAGATGMWQFMKDAAKTYGLRCDYVVDERLDPYRSADAAAKYLRHAYQRFGDWPLAISSYNCGAANVERAIALAGGSTAFWDVYPYLPSETKGYMPAFIAALYTIRFHSLHGIEPRPYSEGAVSNFRITRNMTYKEIIRATGIEQKELVRLNPQYLTGAIPGGERNYILRLPKKYATLFKDNIDVVNAW